jgi:hypothetical protein
MTETVLLCTPSHLPLLRLSLPRLLEVGVVPTVYCCGIEVSCEVVAMGACSVVLPDDDGGLFGTPEFSRFIATKFDVLLDALQRDDVLFLDADVMVERNPIDDLDTDCDIFAQSDGRPDVDGDIVCTGCWWMRSCPEVLSFLAAARARQLAVSRERFYCDEAAVFDELHEPHSLRVKYAPRDLWQNAARWLASDRSGSPTLIHWNGAGRYSVAEKLAAISPSLGGSPRVSSLISVAEPPSISID